MDLLGQDAATGLRQGDVFGSARLGWDLGLRFLGSFRLAVFRLFGHGMLHLNTGLRAQAETVRAAARLLACTLSITKRNVSLATAVTGAARNMPISPKSDAPSSVLKIN